MLVLIKEQGYAFPLGQRQWQLAFAYCKPAASQHMVLETMQLSASIAGGVQHAFASCEVAAAQYAVLRPYCKLKTLPEESSKAEWRSICP